MRTYARDLYRWWSIPETYLILQQFYEFIPFACLFQCCVNRRGNNIPAPVRPRGALNYSPCQRSAFSTQTNTAFPKWKLSKASSNTHKTVLAVNTRAPGGPNSEIRQNLLCIPDRSAGCQGESNRTWERMPVSGFQVAKQRASGYRSAKVFCVWTRNVGWVKLDPPHLAGLLRLARWPVLSDRYQRIYSKGHLIFSHKKL